MLRLLEPVAPSVSAPVPTRVPFMDLRAQFAHLRSEVLPALEVVASSANYVLGPSVANFEEEFARFVGVKHCVGVNSGTSALHLALIQPTRQYVITYLNPRRLSWRHSRHMLLNFRVICQITQISPRSFR